MAGESEKEDLGGRFPPTRASAVLGAKSDDAVVRARAFEILVRAYFRPVYKHLRLRWRKDADAAQEVTQAFFAQAFEKRFFASFDADKAHFRTFLKTCLDRFAAKDARDKGREKRGGGAITLSLDFAGAEAELVRTSEGDVATLFDREWMKSLLSMTVEALEAQCIERDKRAHFEIFKRIALDDDPATRPTYAAIAAELGLSVMDVTNYLNAMRRDFRRIAREKLRELTASDEELEAEAKALFGS